MPVWPFRPSQARQDGARLLTSVTQIGRQSAFFGEGRLADTLDGRLEAIMLHAVLAMVRLQRDRGLAPLSQAFTDALFRYFDDGLREAGVGDTAVPKRMHKIAGSFYGRLDAYSAALDDADALAAAIGRNALRDEAAPFAGVLARYAQETARRHAEADAADMFRLDGWARAPD